MVTRGLVIGGVLGLGLWYGLYKAGVWLCANLIPCA